MSFATGEHVMRCVERVICRLWTELLEIPPKDQPFPRMTYHEAMTKFGSDKPDTRLGMEISDITQLLPPDTPKKLSRLWAPVVEALKFRVTGEPTATRKFIQLFKSSPDEALLRGNSEGRARIVVVDSSEASRGFGDFDLGAAEHKLDLQDGDLVVLRARRDVPHHGGSTELGKLRVALHKAAVAQGLLPAPEGFSFLWVTDFPLFSPQNAAEPGQGGAAGIASTHHPFTSPKSADDVDLLTTDPTKAIGDHYDLVVNGVELGGGSRRIHHPDVQEFIFQQVLQMPPERISQFSHLLKVLRAGCPPHAGIALGFDRLIAVMLGKTSVRDVIAFPKTGSGEDPLVKSPDQISATDLETYHLHLAPVHRATPPRL